MIRVDQEIGKLFRTLLQPRVGTQMFVPTLEECFQQVEYFCDEGIKVAAVCREEKSGVKVQEHIGSQKFTYSQYDDRMYIRPSDRYHLSFGVFDWNVNEEGNLQPLMSKDKLRIHESSKGKPERIAENHIIGLEQMLVATFNGGYFGAVLPKNWLGRDRIFLRWWETNAAQVARINLPIGTVTIANSNSSGVSTGNCETISSVKRKAFSTGKKSQDDGMLHWSEAPGQWQLIVWFRPFEKTSTLEKPNSMRAAAYLDWAVFRYATFMYTLDGLSTGSLNMCAEAFRQSDWWKNSVRLWNKMLTENSTNTTIGTTFYRPTELPKQQDLWFFEPSDDRRLSVRIARDIDEIKSKRFAVQLKPTASRIKVIGYNDLSRGMVHSMIVSDGVTANQKTGEVYYDFSHNVLEKPYSEAVEELASKAVQFGLIPYVTESDNISLKRRETWLNRQLTPNDRYIQVEQPNGDVVWENVYENIGMKATYPELLKLWEKRARSMLIHQYTYEGYQLEDIIIQACKQSMFNGSVMGLGKTREMLFSAILRCVSECLIIVPGKLIGTWQDEIDNTIIPYIRRVRRNWQGQIIECGSANVIQYAADCLPANRRLFNIISYDTLKAIPKDGRFYKCPECGFISFSAMRNTPFCPTEKCNRKLKRWQEKVNQKDEHGRPLVRKHKIEVSTGKRVHWNPEHDSRRGIPESACKVVDIYDQGFPVRPVPPLMLEQDTMYKKMTEITIGYDDMPDGSRVPKKKLVPRKSGHVGWMFADLLRNQFNTIIVDEILYAKNEDALRSRAMQHIKGRTRWGCTGTPMKGMPETILPYYNWIFDREVYPNYRSHGASNGSSSGKKNFVDRYGDSIKVDVVITADGTAVGGKDQRIHKIKNPELFQAEHSPLMIRRIRNEPAVSKYIPRIPQTREEITVPMDGEHRAYYGKLLEIFREWWQKMKEEEEHRKTKGGDLLTKMTYLINCSANPHYMLENVHKSKDDDLKEWSRMLDTYKGPATQKMKKAWEIVEEAVSQGDKAICFGTRRRVLDLGDAWSKRKKLHSMIIDSRVSLKNRAGEDRSPRHIMVEDFRNRSYNVMWAGLACLAEGMNIPEANWGVVIDYSWEPADAMQAIARMLRPQQTKTVHSKFLMHEGTIDEYLAAVCYLKGRSHAEGIDYVEFDDFSVDLIPDIKQYADSIVDGTEHILKRKMWSAVEHIKKQMIEEGEDY